MNRPFLLDTCAALWIVADEISQRTAEALTKSRDDGFAVYVSPITAWEIGNLARTGRFKSHYTPQRWFEVLMEKPNTKMAELTAEILMGSSFLPGNLHCDPADRIIATTAREYGFTVMTRDGALLDYGKQGHLSVLAC